MAKRIMRRFRINEISAVDEPAQQPAKALLMKRAPANSPMLEVVAKHQNEIRKHQAVARHQEALRAERAAS